MAWDLPRNGELLCGTVNTHKLSLRWWDKWLRSLRQMWCSPVCTTENRSSSTISLKMNAFWHKATRLHDFVHDLRHWCIKFCFTVRCKCVSWLGHSSTSIICFSTGGTETSMVCSCDTDFGTFSTIYLRSRGTNFTSSTIQSETRHEAPDRSDFPTTRGNVSSITLLHALRNRSILGLCAVLLRTSILPADLLRSTKNAAL